MFIRIVGFLFVLVGTVGAAVANYYFSSQAGFEPALLVSADQGHAFAVANPDHQDWSFLADLTRQQWLTGTISSALVLFGMILIGLNRFILLLPLFGFISLYVFQACVTDFLKFFPTESVCISGVEKDESGKITSCITYQQYQKELLADYLVRKDIDQPIERYAAYWDQNHPYAAGRPFMDAPEVITTGDARAYVFCSFLGNDWAVLQKTLPMCRLNAQKFEPNPENADLQHYDRTISVMYTIYISELFFGLFFGLFRKD